MSIKHTLIKLKEDNLNSMPTMEILLQENKIIDALLVCMDALKKVKDQTKLTPLLTDGQIKRVRDAFKTVEEMKL